MTLPAAEVVRGEGFDAEIIRTSRKKTATVKVLDGRVSVIVPRATSRARVAALVAQKTRWILGRLLEQRQHPPPEPRQYRSGEWFAYLGCDYRLEVEPGPVRSVALRGDGLVVAVPPSVRKRQQYVRSALVEWYRARALEELRQRVAHYSEVVGAAPSSVSVRTYRARWGSCNTRREVVFNWKLIVAPPRIVDYVVVHELCHLHHLNHGPEFWRCVERALPDFRESRNWLKANGGIARL